MPASANDIPTPTPAISQPVVTQVPSAPAVVPPGPGGKPPVAAPAAPVEGQPPTPNPYALNLPAGTSLDGKILEAFGRSAQDAQVPAATAQSMLEKLAPQIEARRTELQAEQLKAMVDGWKTASAQDRDIGGPKATLADQRIQEAIAKLGRPALGKLLNESGLVHHPEIRALLFRAHEAVSPDRKAIEGTPPAAAVPRRGGLMTNAAASKAMPYKY